MSSFNFGLDTLTVRPPWMSYCPHDTCSRPLPALEHSIQSNVDNGSYNVGKIWREKPCLQYEHSHENKSNI